LLAWGFMTAKDLVGQADYVDLLDKIDDLDNNVDSFANYDKGSAKKYELNFPGVVDYVCLYNSASSGECVLDGASCPDELKNDLDLAVSGSYNLYVLPFGEFDNSRFVINEFYPKNGNPECVSNGNTVLVAKDDGFVSLSYYEG
jgi:hypothetical protein